ncbi:MAG: hypothetical protein ACUVXI_11985 [bacterium]
MKAEGVGNRVKLIWLGIIEFFKLFVPPEIRQGFGEEDVLESTIYLRPFTESPLERWRNYLAKNYRLILFWMILAIVVSSLYFLGWDRGVVTMLLIVVGIIAEISTNFFAFVISFLARLPVLGPPLARILSMPFFILINGLSFIIAFFALRKGRTRRVVNARILVTVFLIGIILGFILGRALK